MNPSKISSLEGLQVSFFLFLVAPTFEYVLTVIDGNILAIKTNAAVILSNM